MVDDGSIGWVYKWQNKVEKGRLMQGSNHQHITTIHHVMWMGSQYLQPVDYQDMSG